MQARFRARQAVIELAAGRLTVARQSDSRGMGVAQALPARPAEGERSAQCVEGRDDPLAS